MINLFVATLVSIVFLAIYLIFLNPLVPLLIAKLKLGDKAILMFYPLHGFSGIVDDSLKKNQDFMHKINNELKKNPKAIVILTNILHKPFLLVTGPEHVKEMYIDHHSFVKVDPFNMAGVMGKGLVMSEGEDWKRQRKFLGNAFTFEKLKARVPMINEVVNKIADSDPKTSLNQFTCKITGEVVIHSFFGDLAQGLKFQGKDAQVVLVELLNEASVLPMNNPYVLLKQFIFGIKSWNILPIKQERELIRKMESFQAIVKELVLKRIAQLKENPLKDQENMVFLDIYVTEFLKEEKNQKKTIQIDEILEQFITLFFAGTDTTATLSGLCLFYLAKFPAIQDELLDEINKVVGNGTINEDHLNKLEKVNAFIQEILRLRNPAFMNLIRYVRQDKQLIDMKLKKGWWISAYHNASSQLDKYFDNAENFDYKRWLNNKSIIKNDNGFIHIPFGAGQRNCIGQHMAMMEAKIIIAILIKKYEIKLNPKIEQTRFGLRFLQCIEPDECIVYERRS